MVFPIRICIPLLTVSTLGYCPLIILLGSWFATSAKICCQITDSAPLGTYGRDIQYLLDPAMKSLDLYLSLCVPSQLAQIFLPTHIPCIIYVGIPHVPRIICMGTWWEFPPNYVGITCKKGHFGTATHVYPTHICPRIIYAYLPTFYNPPRAI